MRPIICLALLLLALPASAAEPVRVIAGTASVIDGDTIELHGERIRLDGIDAPEASQTCTDAAGLAYRCGQQAALALADKIGRRTVTCEQTGRDRYRRTVAICSAGGEDLAGWLVRSGHAPAYRQYSKRYVADEEQARAERAGLWAGEFQAPWDWRRARRQR